MPPNELLDSCEGFDWDGGNVEKNWELHRVAFWESEEVFFDEPLVVASDRTHPQRAPRFFALGQTDAGRFLAVSFTIRGNVIRVISARDMTRSERRTYETPEA